MSTYLVAKRPRHEQSLGETLRDLTQEGILVQLVDIEYPEYRGKIEAIVAEGARECSNVLQSEVIVFRTGLFLDTLKGFPGDVTGYILRCIGTQGILELMKDAENRDAQWIFCLGYCHPGIEPKFFKGICTGEISIEPTGDKGYAFDAIFIPKGYDKTFAENPVLKHKIGARIKAVRKFVRWYRSGTGSG